MNFGSRSFIKSDEFLKIDLGLFIIADKVSEILVVVDGERVTTGARCR